SRCGDKVSIFVAKSDHPLSQALSLHPSAVNVKEDACLHFVIADNGEVTLPHYWDVEASRNVVVVNLSPKSPYTSVGSEIIVQAHFAIGEFRPRIDFALFTNVSQFNQSAWQDRPQILPLMRKEMWYSISPLSPLKYSTLNEMTTSILEQELRDVTFCVLQSSWNFQYELLSSLRAGCIPVVRSLSQTLPFEDTLDWNRVAFTFSKGRSIESIVEMLETMEKEEILEMRRMGRIFANRLEHANALADTLIAGFARRLKLSLHHFTMVSIREKTTILFFFHFKDTQTTDIPANTSVALKRIASRTKSTPALRMVPTVVYDTPMLPNGAHYYNGTKETMESAIGSKSASSFSKAIGLARDVEQFTVVILTFNRDASLVTVLKLLNGCPYLNKVIIVWNNPDRKPEDIWPTIHVPIEFIFPKKNSLLNRFLPYDAIETEAIVSLDDDQNFSHSELVFAFRVWREHRDQLVGFPERYTYMKSGIGKYGLGSVCEYSLILTGFAFMHKEFLYEFTHNQHPFILEHIEKNRNCEDIAMNFLVAHLSRKPPLRVIKKTATINRQGMRTGGLSAKPSHYSARSNCVQIFSEIYGYNPLLQSQHQAVPARSGCMNGL
ncbi:hypothetical protein PFISCL1PPCAC_21442, partial [Pristionchus fissidentatus]